MRPIIGAGIWYQNSAPENGVDLWLRFPERVSWALYKLDEALCAIQYTVHVSLLISVSDEAPSTLASVLRLRSRLSDLIETDFGLLDHLLSLEGLTRKQYNKLRAGVKAAYERSDELLDLLASESDADQCNKFLKALQKTGQQHVVNLVTQNGGQN